jgi:hypothetical protein
LHGVIGEIELDLVESAPDEQTRKRHLQRAVAVCDQALDICRSSTDPGVVGVVLLAQTRIGRLANLPINAQQTVEGVIAQANRDGDRVLMAQWYMSLGFELRRQGVTYRQPQPSSHNAQRPGGGRRCGCGRGVNCCIMSMPRTRDESQRGKKRPRSYAQRLFDPYLFTLCQSVCGGGSAKSCGRQMLASAGGVSCAAEALTSNVS